MKNGYLYIAQDPSRADHLKLGQTKDCPLQRMKSLSAYGQVPFKLIASFPTSDCVAAEKRLFRLLEQFRHAHYRELFNVDAPTASTACIKAIRQTPIPPETPEMRIAAVAMISRSRVWNQLLTCPVRFKGAVLQLGELLFRAHTEHAAAKRIQKLGLQRMAWSLSEATYDFSQIGDGPLSDWLRANQLSLKNLLIRGTNANQIRVGLIPKDT